MTNLNNWPIGAQVKVIEALYGAVVIGKDEYGLDLYGKGIVVPVGSLGTVKEHFDDGRILVGFPCDPNTGHTFAEPEKFLRPVEGQLAGLLAEVDRLRADNRALLIAVDNIKRLARAGATCKPGTCEDCDLLRELGDIAQIAIEEVEAE